jgi:putative transposase
MPDPGPFKYFKTSPKIICLAVIKYVRSPLSLRNAGDILHESVTETSHETVHFRRQGLGPIFAAVIRRRRI